VYGVFINIQFRCPFFFPLIHSWNRNRYSNQSGILQKGSVLRWRALKPYSFTVWVVVIEELWKVGAPLFLIARGSGNLICYTHLLKYSTSIGLASDIRARVTSNILLTLDSNTPNTVTAHYPLNHPTPALSLQNQRGAANLRLKESYETTDAYPAKRNWGPNPPNTSFYFLCFLGPDRLVVLPGTRPWLRRVQLAASQLVMRKRWQKPTNTQEGCASARSSKPRQEPARPAAF